MTSSSTLLRLRLAFVYGIVASASLASADPRDPPAAEALFQQGRGALAEGRYALACEKFAESQRLEPAPGTVMNLAECLERQGKVASAWQRWNEALDLLELGDDRRAFTRKRIVALEKRVPHLTVHLDPAAPRGTRVYRDGVRLGEASHGMALPVDPGRHVVRAVAARHEARIVRVFLAEGDERAVTIEPGAPAPEEDTIEHDVGEEEPGAPLGRTLGYVATGIGIAGGGTGIVTAFLLHDASETVRENCTGRTCNEEGLDAAARGQTLLSANAIGWSAGVVGIVTGAILLMTSGDSTERSPSRQGLVIEPRGTKLHYRVWF